MTTDAAANNGTTADRLKELSENLWGGRSKLLFCLGHINNLAVQAFLQEMGAASKDFREYLKFTVSCNMPDDIEERQSRDSDGNALDGYEHMAFLKVFPFLVID